MKMFLGNAWVLHTILLSFLSGSAKAINILILQPCPSYSHQAAVLALTKRLIIDGHNVYSISPNPVKGMEKNYTYVDISFAYEYISPEEEKEISLELQSQMSKWESITIVDSAMDIWMKQFSSSQVKEFIKRIETEHLDFDVILIEEISTHFLVPLAYEIAGSKPIITITSFSYNYISENSLGSIQHLSYMPSLFSHYSDKMNLWQKIENWLSDYYIVSKMKEVVTTKAKKFMKENFRKISEAMDDPEKRISLSMVTANHIHYYPRLLAPNVIELGAMHIEKPGNLPHAIQDWVDKAEKGIIYFSLGSNFRSKSLSEDAKANLRRTFKELPVGYRVVWKWEAEEPISEQPSNILTQKWVPQQSLLAHPKTKLFITQGGLQSFEETVHYGVPVIGIPWFFDQEVNVGRMVDLGIGVRLDPQELASFEIIKKAVNTVLFNQSYSQNAQKFSAISRDFTARSIDTAVFWILHIARHGGGEHLKPATAHTTYFQFFCLDIISFILVLAFILFYSIFFVSRSIFVFFTQNTILKIKKS